MTHADDELMDLVSDDDEVIGQAYRSEIYKTQQRNFRVVNIFLTNSKGQLWIPRRTHTKRLFPLSLDVSAGGHVASGETYDQAFHRELQEELRIDASITSHRVLGKLTPHTHKVYEFMTVYEIISDDVPDYNADDFIHWFWLYPHELHDLVKSGERAKGDLLPLVQHFYL